MKKIENTVTKARIQFYPTDLNQIQIREGTEPGEESIRIIELIYRDQTSYSLVYDVNDPTQQSDFNTDKSIIDSLIS